MVRTIWYGMYITKANNTMLAMPLMVFIKPVKWEMKLSSVQSVFQESGIFIMYLVSLFSGGSLIITCFFFMKSIVYEYQQFGIVLEHLCPSLAHGVYL